MKRIFSLMLLLCIMLSLFAGNVHAAPNIITTPPTGYDSADDVVYVTSGSTIANWGARGETCVFLSTYATGYYTGGYTYDALSANAGGTGSANAYTSPLYKALQNMMKAKHTTILNYQETRPYYRYTDCVSGNSSLLSSFYSGKMVNGTWDSGKTYNREHTWPNSKGLGGRDEDDIVMLRPTISSENSSRGNTAYGESSGYFDPGVSVRGDCARIALYVYVRWGNTGRMWGSSGVIENLDILLKWMEEDPVDTWEMGRNDAVQSITGVRNVFIDYPEYAWLLFGEEVPADMTTPSGKAKETPPTTVTCPHSTTELRNAKEATCAAEGYTGDTYCTACGQKLANGTTIANLDHILEIVNTKYATCAEAGYTGDTICILCNHTIDPGTATPVSTTHAWGEWGVTKEPTKAKEGSQQRICGICGQTEEKAIPPVGNSSDDQIHWIKIILIAGGCLVVLSGAVILIVALTNRKRRSDA